MVKFLAKLFIKDYQNVGNERVRTSYGSLAGAFGIFTNLVLVVIKITCGILTGAISIIADGVNNLSDMGSSILTIVGFKLSNKPADKEHPFGHQRIEYIFGLIISMIVAFVGIELLSQSIQKIIYPQEVTTSLLIYILLGVSILIKILQGLFYLKASKIISSVSLKASAKDSINDVISTSVVLVGLIISKYINYNLDGILGILVSIFILVTAFGLIKEAMQPLIGEKPDVNLIHKIVKDIKSYKGIYGVHDVMAHLYGPSKVFISLHCEVDHRVDVLESHELIDTIEHDIKAKYEVEIVIHMDPIVIDDPKQNELKLQLQAIIKGIDEKLMYHDFRLTKGKRKINLIFDVVVPYKFKYDNDTVINMINTEMKKIDKRYQCIINIDNDYIGEE